jgi:hypothetical protein
MPPPRSARSCADGGYLFADAPADLTGSVLWRPELVSTTIPLDAAPDEFAEAKSVDPGAFAPLLADCLSEDGRHVIIEDASGEHRLWLRDTTPGRRMAVMIPLDRDFNTRMASLMRFHRRLFGKPPGPPPRGWTLSTYRRHRLDLMLRALDLHLAGSSYREIAVALGEADAANISAAEWKGSPERAFVIRLVASANRMMNGGYRRLLRGR